MTKFCHYSDNFLSKARKSLTKTFLSQNQCIKSHHVRVIMGHMTIFLCSSPTLHVPLCAPLPNWTIFVSHENGHLHWFPAYCIYAVMSVAYQSRLLRKTDKEIFPNERLRLFYWKALISTDKKMQELWHKQNTTEANILTINPLSIHKPIVYFP